MKEHELRLELSKTAAQMQALINSLNYCGVKVNLSLQEIVVDGRVGQILFNWVEPLKISEGKK